MQTEVQQLVAALPAKAISGASRLGLIVSKDVDGAAWHELMGRLAQLTQTTHGARQTLTAWLGDALAHERAPRRGQIAQFAAVAGLDPGTLRNAKMVCRRIPVSRRHDALTWSHHCEIGLAFSAPDEIEQWLRLAEKESLPTAELRQRIRRHLAAAHSDAAAGEGNLPFRLMRDLRTAARTVDQLESAWQRWPQATAEFALDEIQTLARFIDAIRKRARTQPVARAARTPVPRDLSLN